MVVFWLLLLCLLPEIFCQRIPLRFDQAIERLNQYQNFKPIDILDDNPYEITSIHMSNYLSSLAKHNVTTTCEKEFDMIVGAAVERETWALSVLDAWGKPLPSGVLRGNVVWTGNYDQCVQDMYVPENKTYVKRPINTQYCTLYPTPYPPDQTQLVEGITLGLCVPLSCDRQSVALLIREFFKKDNITEKYLVCSNDPRNGQKGLTRGAIATITILSILGLLVLVGTITDLILTTRLHFAENVGSNVNGYIQFSDDEVVDKKSMTPPRAIFIAEFSALRTLHHLFTIKTRQDDKSFSCINGIRVLALFWVIIGHSILFSVSYTSDVMDILAWSHSMAFQLIVNAVFSVDTFFVLSGFLTAILFVRQVDKEGKLSFRTMGLYYLHRYIRLSPVFYILILVSINLTAYFGEGPMFPISTGFEGEDCREKYWWASFLYVANLVKPNQMCFGIAWYLHNDMQFHWIAPLALIPFVLGRKPIGFFVVILFVLVGIGSVLGISLYYPNLPLNMLDTAQNGTGPDFFSAIYVSPWCRISAYAVGILAGFFVVNTGRAYRLNVYVKLIGTLLAILMALACLFSTYQDYTKVPGLNRASLIAFEALSRTAWSLAIGWLLFLCSTHQGGIVNRILSWPIWIPLARLNYSAYLIHATILYIIIYNQTMPTYYQPHIIVNNFIAHIFVSYLAAIVVYIFLETPFVIIEKKLFKR